MKNSPNPALTIAAMLLALLFSRCNHYYYAPNSMNAPLLKEKGETHIQAAWSSGNEFNGFELQAASAVTNHTAVLCNFMTAGHDDGDGNSGHGTYFEPGAGYFRSLGKHFTAEGFGEIGIGGVTNHYAVYYGSGQTFESHVFLVKGSLQPEIGFNSKVFDAAISARISGLQYLSESDNLEDGDRYDLEYINQHRFSVLVEPAFTIRLGYKYVKLQAQLVQSFNLNNPDLAQEVANFNLGLHFTIPPSKNPKAPPDKTN